MHLLLRGSCLTCHIILLNRSQLVLLFFKLQALNNGLYQLTNDLEEKYRLVRGKNLVATVVMTILLVNVITNLFEH